MTKPEPQPAATKSKRRWYQYSLRTLLAAVTLASVGMSWFTASRQWVEQRRRGICLDNLAEIGVTRWPWLDDKGRTDVLKLAKRACELSGWKNPAFLATLAAAQALNGDFAAARQLQAKAIDLENDATRKQIYSADLALYEVRKPYREVKYDWWIEQRFRLASRQPPTSHGCKGAAQPPLGGAGRGMLVE